MNALKNRRFILQCGSLLFLMISYHITYSQLNGNVSDSSFIHHFKLAPLDTLISKAISHSSILKAQEAVVKQKDYSLKLNKMNWLDWVKGTGNFNYGSGNTLTTDQGGGESSLNLSTRLSAIYNIGLSVSISPYDLLSRKREQKKLRSEILQQRHVKEDMVLVLTEEVIKRYQAVELSLKLLKHQISSLESSRLTYKIAERAFKEGNLNIPDYNLILETKLKSEISFETALAQLKEAIMMLETLVGSSITN